MFLNKQNPSVTYIYNITSHLIDRYKSYRVNQEVKNKTINAELVLIRALFRMAVKNNYLVSNPADDIQKLKAEERTPPRYLTQKECEQLLSAADPYAYNIFFTFLNTGLRKHELENLTWNDVDLDQRHIHVTYQAEHQTVEEERFVPINADLLVILKECKESSADKSLVFVDRKGRKLSKNYLRNLLIKTAQSSGLENVTQVNSLRYTFAAHLIINNIELPMINKLMGTADQQLDYIYKALTQRKTMDAVNVLSFKSSQANPREAND